jgi:predicted RNA polymerase sigma factor
MTYRVYSGPKGAAEILPFEKERMLFKELITLDDALAFARHLGNTGRIPVLIEGDDGTRLDRREIGEALGVGSREQVTG